MENDTPTTEDSLIVETGKLALKSAAIAVGACLGIVLVHALTSRTPGVAIDPVETPTS